MEQKKNETSTFGVSIGVGAYNEKKGARAAIEVVRGEAGSRCRRELDFVHQFHVCFCFPCGILSGRECL